MVTAADGAYTFGPSQDWALHDRRRAADFAKRQLTLPSSVQEQASRDFQLVCGCDHRDSRSNRSRPQLQTQDASVGTVATEQKSMICR